MSHIKGTGKFGTPKDKAFKQIEDAFKVLVKSAESVEYDRFKITAKFKIGTLKIELK